MTPVLTELPISPYKGLANYTEHDAALFFGRDREREVIIANLKARRLTLLYGESGVGKSSLLRAGVMADLTEAARRNLADIGTPEHVPVSSAPGATNRLPGSPRRSALRSMRPAATLGSRPTRSRWS